MLRSIFLVAPILAFAVPFVASQPSSARPMTLASQPQETQWCWGDCEEENEEGEENEICEDVTVCVFAHVKLCRDDRRSFSDTCSDTCSELAADGCSAHLGASASPSTLAACTAELATRCQLECRPKDLALSIDPSFGGGGKPGKPGKPGGGGAGDGGYDGDGDGGGYDGDGDGGGYDGDGDGGGGGCHSKNEDCVTVKVKACASGKQKHW